MRRAPLARLFWIGAAALLGVAALVAIAAVVRGEVTETDGRILASLGSALLAGGCLLSGLALKESGRARARRLGGGGRLARRARGHPPDRLGVRG